MVELDSLRRRQQFYRDDISDVVEHGLQTQCGKGRHADVVFLICRGRNAIDARRVSERLVFRCQCRCHNLRHHEPGIQAAFFDQKRRQAAQVIVNKQRDASFRLSTDFGNREREIVGRQRDGLCMKISA